MDKIEAIGMAKAKLKCLENRTSGRYELCDRECDDCDINYMQGNMGEQKEWLSMAIHALEEQEKRRWIPVSEALPEDTEKSGYIMLSYENFSLPDIGRYEVDKDGGGIFYPGDDERSCLSYGLFVNAWMPLPAPYKKEVKE